MKKFAYLIFATFLCTVCGSLMAGTLKKNITNEIPEINAHPEFQKTPNVAQYKEADWSQAIGIARDVSLSEACEIANRDPAITFFFYTKGGRMVLEKPDGSYRVFNHGDAVFFSGEPWWGSAPGLADGYVKKQDK